MQRFFEGKKWLLLIAIVLAGSHARAQGTRDTLTLNLDKALEIALSDNPTIKVAEEEIALKKVRNPAYPCHSQRIQRTRRAGGSRRNDTGTPAEIRRLRWRNNTLF